jgi:ATP-dependent protease ClpP protease subunit
VESDPSRNEGWATRPKASKALWSRAGTRNAAASPILRIYSLIDVSSYARLSANMSWDERIELYKKIEAHRKRPLIVYVTSKRNGAGAYMSTDALPQIIEQLDALPVDAKALDFLIVSYGGDPMVAWRIMTLVRQRVDEVFVMIPQSAYSAATLLALGADEIVMHPNGHLGPVDMQITMGGGGGQPRTFSTEDISAFLDFVRDNLKITDQEHVRALFEITCREVGSLGIGLTARSSKLAVDLGERLLALHMKDEDAASKLRSIVQNMSRKFQSHAYPVNRKEALDIGLPVNKEQDTELEKLMWDVWLNIEHQLKERIPFDAVIELLNSPEATKLLAPVPQLVIPPNVTSSAHYNTSIGDVMQHATVTVNPVDFEYTNALVESSRAGSRNVTKGKILACRTPDLMIKYNRVVRSLEWETEQGEKGGGK